MFFDFVFAVAVRERRAQSPRGGRLCYGDKAGFAGVMKTSETERNGECSPLTAGLF